MTMGPSLDLGERPLAWPVQLASIESSYLRDDGDIAGSKISRSTLGNERQWRLSKWSERVAALSQQTRPKTKIEPCESMSPCNFHLVCGNAFVIITKLRHVKGLQRAWGESNSTNHLGKAARLIWLTEGGKNSILIKQRSRAFKTKKIDDLKKFQCISFGWKCAGLHIYTLLCTDLASGWWVEKWYSSLNRGRKKQRENRDESAIDTHADPDFDLKSRKSTFIAQMAKMMSIMIQACNLIPKLIRAMRSLYSVN